MKLYISDVSLFDESFFEKALFVPLEKKGDLGSFRNPLSKKEHILAWSLLSYAYESKTGRNSDEIKLIYAKNGKPYLGTDPFFFNLSHSGGRVICAVSEKEVGADVQFVKEPRPVVVKRVLCENEQKALDECEDARDVAFMRFWTQKESYLKYTGEGIAAGLSDFDFSSAAGKDRFRLFSKEFWTFSEKGFVYSVCFESGSPEKVFLSPDDFSSLTC